MSDSAGLWELTSRNTNAATVIDYEPSARIYTVSHTYHVTGIPVEEIPNTVAGDDTYPAIIPIVHQGVDIDGTNYSQTVNCFVAGSPAILISPTSDGVVEAVVHYRGRVLGFHNIVSAQVDRTFQQFWDLKPKTSVGGPDEPPAGTVYHQGIGIDFAGYAVSAPLDTWGLLVVVPTSEFETIKYTIMLVTPMANENDWKPPSSSDAVEVARYSCQGLTNVNSDPVTQTTEFIIRFEHDPWKWQGQHLYPWRKAIDIHPGIELIRTYDSTIISSQIYELAGNTNTKNLSSNPSFDLCINNCYSFTLTGGTTTQRLLVR